MKKQSDGLKTERCWEIDLIRGICIIYVSIFHFCYVGIFLTSSEICKAILYHSFFDAIHYPMVFILLFISGISRTFTKDDKKRFFKIACFALLITWVTTLGANLIPDLNGLQINFGILHAIASCIVIYIFLDWLLSKIPMNKYIKDAILLFIGAGATVVGILYLYNVGGMANHVPAWASFWATGNSGYQLSPGDYFAVLPLLGFYIFGAIFGKYVYKQRKTLTRIKEPIFVKPFTWCGKYSLWIYLAVPVLSVALFSIIS